jgi:hypothetical protein
MFNKKENKHFGKDYNIHMDYGKDDEDHCGHDLYFLNSHPS